MKQRPGVTERSMERISKDGREGANDRVAVEEPLEIRVSGDPLAITMRTPGDDRLLAVGFLFAEGVIASLADIGTVAHCGRQDEPGWGNVIDVTPGPGVVLDPSLIVAARRGTLTTASCGTCGRRSIDDLLERVGRNERDIALTPELLASAPARLEGVQIAFAHTGGMHGAAALNRDGKVLAYAEDVGRHNAVDKVLGRLLYDRRIGSGEAVVLVVSGRVSFEIVQKAAVARIPAICAVSAPTSLAVDLAERAGITLAAFVRNGHFNVYAHGHRIKS
jgi:FdhD protein